MNNNIIVFYGIPNNKRDCYKYARKTYDGWNIVWYNSYDDIEIIIPLSLDDIEKLNQKEKIQNVEI